MSRSHPDAFHAADGLADPRPAGASFRQGDEIPQQLQANFWLFSGWNCVAKTLSRQTEEANVSPYFVRVATMDGSTGCGKEAVDEIDVAAAGHAAEQGAVGIARYSSWFQPICGILRPGCSEKRTTLPGKTPRPAAQLLNSSLFSKSAW